MRYILILLIVTQLICLSCTDHRAPEVAIMVPSDGALIYGIATVHLIANDNETVDSVALFIDNECVRAFAESPFLYSWDTRALADSSVHELYGLACDDKGNEGWSDTISVTVINGTILFADDFESYIAGNRPSPIWHEIWPGVLDSTYVSQVLPHNGLKSYRSYGYAEYVRTDGVEVTVSDIQRLIYECSTMIPEGSGNGALMGFFVWVSPQLGEIYDGVMFDPDDHRVYVRGGAPDTTGFIWASDVWYNVRVVLDITQAYMEVWIDDQQIAVNIPMADTAWLDTFALSTIYGYNGDVLYDDVMIYSE
jgi:hypothetical protein